jgi:Rap1a immunity proteins
VEDQAKNAELASAANFCSGVVHGLAYVGKILPAELIFCAPPTSDARQLARVVINYIDAHPQRMHEDFRMLTLEAFHQAWPCKSDR